MSFKVSSNSINVSHDHESRSQRLSFSHRGSECNGDFVAAQDISTDKPIKSKTPMTKLQKYLYTFIVCYTNMAYGIIATGVSPSLVDLKYIIKTDINKVGIYFTIISVGYVCGSLFGVLFKYINRQITILILSTLMGICFAFIPHSPSLFIYYLLAFLIGICCGAFDCVSVVWFIELWQTRCNTFLQISQFSYGVGTVISPLISKPFVYGKIEEDEQIVNDFIQTSNFTFVPREKTPRISDSDRKSSLTLPFLIMGFIQLMSAVFQLLMLLFYERYYYDEEGMRLEDEERRKKKKESNSSSDTIISVVSLDEARHNDLEQSMSENREKLFNNSPYIYKLMIIILGALCLAAYNSTEIAHFQFSPTYSQYIPMKLSASEAAVIHSFFAASFSIGRGLGVLISIKIRPQTMLVGNYVILTTALIILLLSINSKNMMILGNILMGLGCSSIWATFFAYIEQYLMFSDRLGTIFIFIVGLVQAIAPLILGPFIENQPILMIYFNLTTLAISIITFAIILLIVNVYHRKHSSDMSIRQTAAAATYLDSSVPRRVSITSINAASSYLQVKHRLSLMPVIEDVEKPQ